MKKRDPFPAPRIAPKAEVIRLPGPKPAKPDRVNVYTCADCGTETVTIDIHEGVTPFMLHRPWAQHVEGCDGHAYSSFYQPRPGHGPPTIEWYRASEDEAHRAGPAMYQHHAQGGLFIRRQADAAPAAGARP
jgi:hypothetical protein